MAPIRLLIVDDSAIMRRAIQQVAQKEPDIEVAGTATNGLEGVHQAQALRPDVVTMDVEMPQLNGIEALQQIMATAPTRVLMVSSLTTAGAATTLEALALGAVDFLPKQVGSAGAVQITALQEALPAKIRAAAAANLDAVTARPAPPPAPARRLAPPASPPPARTGKGMRILLIGTSTGGPNALQRVIPALPESLEVGVLIVQHMPPLFTAQLARRLDGISAVHVREAVEGDAIEPGTVLLAPGDRHLVLRSPTTAGLDEEPADADHRPSVDVLFASAAQYYGTGSVATILTGMGRDGCEGAQRLKKKGATILAQDGASSVVNGMPGSIVAAGLADTVCPLSMMPAAIQRSLRS